MSLEMSSDSKTMCIRCGKEYGNRHAGFFVCYAPAYKGIGYIPACKTCIDNMYKTYLAQCGNTESAVRQMCRKLDLFWSQKAFDSVSRRSIDRTVMSKYITKINSGSFIGKCYDDTLSNEGTLWNFGKTGKEDVPESEELVSEKPKQEEPKTMESIRNSVIEGELREYMDDLNNYPVTKDVIAFWGAGYPPEMYSQLEQRRAYWMSRIPDEQEIDIGTEAIIRQICPLELDINRDRAAGKPVDKSVNALNTLLGSANWKPIQRKEEADNSLLNPMGVWLYRYENKRPLPALDKKKYDDVNKNRKNIFTWMGHLCKMLSKKNAYAKLYEEEMEKYRIERPTFEDLDGSFDNDPDSILDAQDAPEGDKQ